MVKGNNMLPNGHFHKDWQRRVKTWFAQPSKKLKRRQVRAAKAAKLAPRPLNKLKPAVRCPTIKYNSRIRAGRGFTLEELRAAGINVHFAPTVGISVDHRRKNRSEEAFRKNVSRLKLYRSKLVVFPRKCGKKLKQGDSSADSRKAVTQNVNRNVLALPRGKPKLVARAITEEEKKRRVTHLLRRARTEARIWGQRQKRAKDYAEGKMKKKEKGTKKADDKAEGGDD